jgi:hypothetical protein
MLQIALFPLDFFSILIHFIIQVLDVLGLIIITVSVQLLFSFALKYTP